MWWRSFAGTSELVRPSACCARPLHCGPQHAPVLLFPCSSRRRPKHIISSPPYRHHRRSQRRWWRGYLQHRLSWDTTVAASDADDAANCRTASAETPPSQPATQMTPLPAARHRSSRPILAEALFVCATRLSSELVSSHRPRPPRLCGSLSCRAHRL